MSAASTEIILGIAVILLAAINVANTWWISRLSDRIDHIDAREHTE